jgi:hypothetical protein
VIPVMKHFRLSMRELLLLIVVAALTLAFSRNEYLDAAPVYQHLFHTHVDSTHDEHRPEDSPISLDGLPWTRVASVRVYDRRPFGLFTPNDRRPAVAIDGKLIQTWKGEFRGQLHIWIDDNNVTFDVSDVAENLHLRLDDIYYIDPHCDCLVLSRSDDPYEALSRSIKPGDANCVRAR